MTEENPRIIHRIYFDNFSPFYDPFEHYLESWSREMPDYKVMRWSAENLDVGANRWTRIAYEKKAPVFLAEYFRWKLLAEHGGIYLDADCEILDGKVLRGIVDELYAGDDYDVFFGVEERGNGHPTAQTVGAKRGSDLVKFMLHLYEDCLPDLWEWRERRGLIGPQLMALYYLGRGINVVDDGLFKNLDTPTVIDRAKVYPQTYFSPKFSLAGETLDHQIGKTCIYHMFANSNVDFSQKRQLQKVQKQAATFEEYQAALKNAVLFPRTYDISWFSTDSGTITDEAIVAKNVNGTVMYGPYIALTKGEYKADISLSRLSGDGQIEVRVTADMGHRTLSTTTIPSGAVTSSTLSVEFAVQDESTANIEFIVRVAGVSDLAISGMRLDRIEPCIRKNSLKVLHRIYFGFDGKPDQFLTYLDTWKQQLPDFEIRHWDASNLPMDINPYVRKLYQEKDHAFLTDYFRWYVLREHGGSYLDADVEVVNGSIYRQLIEDLEATDLYEAFIGIDERSGGWYTAHSMASKPQSELSRFMCDLYANFGSFTAWRKKGFYFWAPQLVGLYFTNMGHNRDGMGTTPRLDSPVVEAGVKIYPQDWFSPLSPSNNHSEVFALNGLSANTCLCHHFACSWHDADSPYLKYSQTLGGQSKVLLSELVKRVAAAPSFDVNQMNTAAGIKHADRITTNATAGYLVYGPYTSLAAGKYTMQFQLDDIHSLNGAHGDVVANQGSDYIVPRFELDRVNDSGVFELPFDLAQAVAGLEFRIMVDSSSRFAFKALSLSKR
jgi:mannosyltransferase OCH1-like enzyme